MSPALRAWLPALAYMALIWVVSSFQMTMSLGAVPLQDKGVHFAEYAVLSLLYARALRGSQPRLGLFALCAIAAVAASFWGLIDEIHQAYVGRNADPMDVLADTIGAVAGTLAYATLAILKRRST